VEDDEDADDERVDDIVFDVEDDETDVKPVELVEDVIPVDDWAEVVDELAVD